MRKALGFGAFVLLIGTLFTGTAFGKTAPPTVQQVSAQEQLVVQDEQAAQTALQKELDFPKTQTICQGQLEHATALRAMVRPTKYPKATWKIEMQGADLEIKAATECGPAAQAAIASPAGHLDISGFHQVQDDWNAGNAKFTTAGAALAKAKIG